MRDCLADDVVWGFRNASEGGEPGRLKDGSHTGFAGLVSKTGGAVLRERAGNATEEAHAVTQRGHVAMVVLSRILCEWFDQHHVSVDGKLCSGMRSGASGIPHVVETIKETDQVEGSGVTVGAGHLERHIVEAESGRCGAGRLNRWCMKVKAGECALRKGARHAHRRCAVAAANIGNHDSCVQAVGPAGQRRHPLLDEEMVVGGAEQLLGSLKK